MSVMNFIENISPFMKLTNYFREGGEVCERKEKKQVQTNWDEKIVAIEEIVEVVKENGWLMKRPSGGNEIKKSYVGKFRKI